MNDSQQFFEKVGTALIRARPRQRHHWDGELIQIRDPESMSGEKRWAANRDIFWGATQTYDTLPPGLYRCAIAEGIGPILTKQEIATDDIIELPNSVAISILQEFESFWDLEEEFQKRGFLMKRGYLFWGPAGSGKTVLINLLIQKLITDQKGIVIFIDEPRNASAVLRMVRQIERYRPIIAVLEELDALVERHGENEYLALLDGETQVHNIVYLATTNFPERLDRRFVDRPAQFDTVTYIGMPSAAARYAFLKAKEPSLTPEELDLWVRLSDGFSVAHLKELIISVKCFKQPLESVIARLEQMHGRIPNSSDTRISAIGFTRVAA